MLHCLHCYTPRAARDPKLGKFSQKEMEEAGRIFPKKTGIGVFNFGETLDLLRKRARSAVRETFREGTFWISEAAVATK